MKPYRHHDWRRLIGTPVEVRRDFEIVRTGVVDDAMEDSSAVWIAADARGGRTLFAAAEGFEVWIRPQELGGKLCFKMAAAQLSAPAPDRELPRQGALRTRARQG
jgi:hypothetical protein